MAHAPPVVPLRVLAKRRNASMGQMEKKERSGIGFFSSLSWTLVLSFLLFTLVPMTLVSLLSYQEAYNVIKRETKIQLQSTAKMKTREIKSYFDTLVALFGLVSETQGSADFLRALLDAQKGAGGSVADFVKSYNWAIIVDSLSDDIRNFQRSYEFYDVFLISNSGDVLFTVAGEDDLGTNLFTGPLSSTKFAAACKRTVLTGERSFSDYERYRPSGNKVVGFLSAPVIDDNGERIGVVAFQISLDHITQIMGEELLLGRTAETYLIGPDLTLRSGLRTDSGNGLLEDRIVTEQTRLFRSRLEEGVASSKIEKDVLVYDGPHGLKVLGIYNDFRIQNIIFAVITEVAKEEAFAAVWNLRREMQGMVLGAGGVALIFALLLVRRLVRPVSQLTRAMEKVNDRDFGEFPEIKSKNEIGALGLAFADMVAILAENQAVDQRKEWFQTGQMELNSVMRGIYDLPEFCRELITFLANYLEVDIGAVYITDDKRQLRLTGSYAFSTRKQNANGFAFGEGVVGQAALEQQRIMLTSVPEDYVTVSSGLGVSRPRAIMAHPLVRDNLAVGVIELGCLREFPQKAMDFMVLVEENIGISIQRILGQMRVQELLQHSQSQTEELAVQQEELRLVNDGLKRQTAALQESRTILQDQQEELKETNEELEEQTQFLEEQKNILNSQNIELDRAKVEVEKKAEEVAVASRYKSEFLANMSHELRTPLNSILLLSRHLADNKDQNMSDKQVECAATVHSSGSELLDLINEILDLARVESGMMALELEECFFGDMLGALKRSFQAVAESKELEYLVEMADDMPESFETDCQRLAQIIKNLLSNAFKFTAAGRVTLELCMRPGPLPITFIVKDTGIGIAQDKIATVFHAFQQADGSTSRKYGGTGLGLSISRELAILLGGTLEAESVLGEGSLFILSLPEKATALENAGLLDAVPSPVMGDQQGEQRGADSPLLSSNILVEEQEYVRDDRRKIGKNSRSILIIEDDPGFAKILRDAAREKGLMVLVAESGETGLQLTTLYEPDGILLDMSLPGMDGKAILFRLKDNLATRHIPVHVMSSSEVTLEPMRMGAVGYLSKPVTMESIDSAFSRIEKVLLKEVKKVLIIEDNELMQQAVADLIGNGVVKTTIAATGAEAKALLAREQFDCIILDYGLPDMNGAELLNDLKGEGRFQTPVIIHTARDLTAEERKLLDDLAGTIIYKDAKSMDRLMDESSLFLHRIASDLPEAKKAMIQRLHDREAILEHKKILIVDDDMRNVFSMSSILEEKGIHTLVAENGKIALTRLQENPDIDLILMDIMMPEMDGYEAMREIRKMDAALAKVGIIALTAKAMKGDRAKCIEAGANDYLSKPVDMERLFSMLRVWLY